MKLVSSIDDLQDILKVLPVTVRVALKLLESRFKHQVLGFEEASCLCPLLQRDSDCTAQSQKPRTTQTGQPEAS
jgi:hypothetical protein